MAPARRSGPSWFVGDNGSGAEASSPPPDVRRSSGRGVEEATGIPRSGTPGQLGRPSIHTQFINDRPRLSTECSLNDVGRGYRSMDDRLFIREEVVLLADIYKGLLS